MSFIAIAKKDLYIAIHGMGFKIYKDQLCICERVKNEHAMPDFEDKYIVVTRDGKTFMLEENNFYDSFKIGWE